jgi:hypothetical protein
MESFKANREANVIVKLLTLIANNQGISIKELSEITNISMEVIKKNLEYISNNHELYFINLLPEEEYDEGDCNCMDIKWTLDYFPEDVFVLSLNCLEKYLYKDITTHNITKYDEFLGVKTKANYELENYNYKLCQISMAVSNKKSLMVKYKNKAGVAKDFKIEPLAVVFYEFDNILYVIGQYNNSITTYRLDRILHIKETNDSFIPLIGFDIKKYSSQVWGMEQGEGKRVKIKFMNTGNVIYKVKRDLECRKNKKITEYPEHMIYEDMVIGINSFKSWLRTYGGAAIVLEPEELRRDMIDSAKRCLEYYL